MKEGHGEKRLGVGKLLACSGRLGKVWLGRNRQRKLVAAAAVQE